MKKILSILILVAISFSSTSACDFCNCYLGLDPGYNKNTIGIRGQYRYATHMMPATGGMKIMHGGDETPSGVPMEELQADFVRYDLHARVYPFKKLQVIATVPFHMNTLTFMDKQESRNSVGDMTVIGMYQLFNTMTTDSSAVRHRIFAGGGVKLPTGKSEGASDADIPMSHHLYNGTGSTDYLINFSYLGKYRKFGWNADFSYKLNGESANDYKFGNTFNAVPRLFYELSLKSVKLLPHVGAAYEMGDHDAYLGNQIDETGGSVFWGTAGIDFYVGSFSLTSDVRLPMASDLGASLPEDKIWLFGSFNFHF